MWEGFAIDDNALRAEFLVMRSVKDIFHDSRCRSVVPAIRELLYLLERLEEVLEARDEGEVGEVAAGDGSIGEVSGFFAKRTFVEVTVLSKVQDARLDATRVLDRSDARDIVDETLHDGIRWKIKLLVEHEAYVVDGLAGHPPSQAQREYSKDIHIIVIIQGMSYTQVSVSWLFEVSNDSRDSQSSIAVCKSKSS